MRELCLLQKGRQVGGGGRLNSPASGLYRQPHPRAHSGKSLLMELPIHPKLPRQLLGKQLDANIAIKISANSWKILVTLSLFPKPAII